MQLCWLLQIKHSTFANHAESSIKGGPECSKQHLPLKVALEWDDQLGMYGEPLGNRAFGLETESGIIVTRDNKWTVNHKGDT